MTDDATIQAAHDHLDEAHRRVSDTAFDMRQSRPSFEEQRLGASFAALDVLTVVEIAECWSPTFASLLARKLSAHLEARRVQDEAVIAKAERRAARAS